jgi:hypothetical protein
MKEPVQKCSLCLYTLKRRDYPEVPLCGECRALFVASAYFDLMLDAAGKKPGTPRTSGLSTVDFS